MQPIKVSGNHGLVGLGKLQKKEVHKFVVDGLEEGNLTNDHCLLWFDGDSTPLELRFWTLS